MKQSTPWIKVALTALLFLLLAGPLKATPLLSIEPGYTSAGVGDPVVLDLVWHGNGQNYLGDYDVDIGFNDTLLSLDSVTFGFGLDPFGCIPFVTCDYLDLGGVVDIWEVSFLVDPIDLMDNQDLLGNDFLLASLSFTALAEGLTPVSLSVDAIGDEFGTPIQVDTRGASVCIGDPQQYCSIDIPEPPVWTLMLLPLIMLQLRRR